MDCSKKVGVDKLYVLISFYLFNNLSVNTKVNRKNKSKVKKTNKKLLTKHYYSSQHLRITTTSAILGKNFSDQSNNKKRNTIWNSPNTYSIGLSFNIPLFMDDHQRNNKNTRKITNKNKKNKRKNNYGDSNKSKSTKSQYVYKFRFNQKGLSW